MSSKSIQLYKHWRAFDYSSPNDSIHRIVCNTKQNNNIEDRNAFIRLFVFNREWIKPRSLQIDASWASKSLYESSQNIRLIELRYLLYLIDAEAINVHDPESRACVFSLSKASYQYQIRCAINEAKWLQKATLVKY